MARKKNDVDHNTVIQFRPGEAFGREIAELASVWKVSRNEVVRRLALLAKLRLTIDHYPALDRLAKSMGGPNDFVRACDYVRGVLDGADHSHRLERGIPLSDGERTMLLEACVDDHIAALERKPARYRNIHPVGEEKPDEAQEQG